MLDDVVKFILEWVVEEAVESGIQKTSFRIKGRPYLTCIYRGFMLSVVIFIGLSIWHFKNNVSLTQTLNRDLIFSGSLGAIIAFILLFITACWRLFTPRSHIK